ncbi:uncharacterized protein LOC112574467 [Pomacea canaliculata]|nr:uncharacterized protein LOC112574467 [Pomacea canaliculata]
MASTEVRNQPVASALQTSRLALSKKNVKPLSLQPEPSSSQTNHVPMSSPKSISNPQLSRIMSRKLSTVEQPWLMTEDATEGELESSRRTWADRNGNRPFTSSVDEGVWSRKGQQLPRRALSMVEDGKTEIPQHANGGGSDNGMRPGVDKLGISLSTKNSEEGGSQTTPEITSQSPIQSPSSTSSFTAHAWDMFEEHVRGIAGKSESFGRRQSASFSASDTFHQTMVQLFGSPDYGTPPPPPTPSPAKVRSLTTSTTKFLSLRKQSSMLEETPRGSNSHQEVNLQTVGNAKRGWRILKQHVLETSANKRTSQAALCWGMLRQTLKGMTDRERTRWDLYRRYGVVPSLDEDGKVVMENTMLSERARKALANGSRHPLLAHTSSSGSTTTTTQTLFEAPASSTTTTSTPSNGAGRSERQRAKSSPLRHYPSATSNRGREPQSRTSRQRRASEVPSRSQFRTETP